MIGVPLLIAALFLEVYFISFGGVFAVLPVLERWIVIDHQWLTHDRFIQAFVLGQFIPGPNMAMCPLMGYWIAGWPGFVGGFVGIYSGPLALIGFFNHQYSRLRAHPAFGRVERALRPYVVGNARGIPAAHWE